MKSATAGAVSFVTGVVLALVAIFGGISAITPSKNGAVGQIVNYDAP